MSKLADAINRALRPEARPIGFGAAASRRIPTMVLLARAGSAEAITAAVTAGADAIISTNGAAPANGVEGAVHWGSEAPVAGRAGAKALRTAGADFLVFDDAITDAAVLLESDLGFVMRVSLDAEDTFLRTVESLPLDGLLVPGLSGALTVRRTLDLRRIASFTRKPLILSVDADIDLTALETLRDCGVVAVVVDDADAVASLRSKIDALPPRRRVKDARGPAALVPSSGSRPIEVPEDDDDA